MNRTRNISIVAIIAILCSVSAWQFARGTWIAIEQTLADEQTEIFAKMVGMASESLEREPPDLKAAVGFLEYTHKTHCL